MTTPFNFSLQTLAFDKNYVPAENTRITTNFANLARGEHRQQNLHNALTMLNQRFNSLADWDNPTGERYQVELDIISVTMNLGDTADIHLPLIEMLKTTIVDNTIGQRIDGIVGNNFSSYVRDYDFSVRLLEHNKNQAQFSVPDDFGNLHAKLYQSFVNSSTYAEHFAKAPVICLSVSTTKIYHRTTNVHPILGTEYRQETCQKGELSLTDTYFGKMGLQVRYFMPKGSVAPLAFYFTGDLLKDYSNLELISTISTMETFQKIYRPEIYNANIPAGTIYQPSLSAQNYSLTRIVYDREERSRLATQQGKYVEEQFIKPYQTVLENWAKTVDFA